MVTCWEIIGVLPMEVDEITLVLTSISGHGVQSAVARITAQIMMRGYGRAKERAVFMFRGKIFDPKITCRKEWGNQISPFHFILSPRRFVVLLAALFTPLSIP